MINEKQEKRNPEQYTTFDEGVAGVKEELNKALLSAPIPIRPLTEHLSRSGGKNIRALSFLACAENNDGTLHRDAVKLAVSIELLHLATLVHDDVIDNAEVRRGLTSVQKQFGKKPAVICGDYLFCLALQAAASVSRKREYLDYDVSYYMQRVCLGELQQDANNRNFALSVFRYLKIIAGKTAALFEASFYGGALVSDDAKEEASHYAKIGHYLGMIFQLTDDCIDYESSAESAKKPVRSDYEQGVVTLPLILSFQSSGELRQMAESGAAKEEIGAGVKRENGVSRTRQVSLKYYDKAMDALRRLNAPEGKKQRLTAILNKACGIVG